MRKVIFFIALLAGFMVNSAFAERDTLYVGSGQEDKYMMWEVWVGYLKRPLDMRYNLLYVLEVLMNADHEIIAFSLWIPAKSENVSS